MNMYRFYLTVTKHLDEDENYTPIPPQRIKIK